MDTDAAILMIDDDGRGFDPAASTPEGLGLANLRSRVERLGGELAIDSGTGSGTTIRVRLPR
jgi:signal transduction histidine kinase